MTELMYVRTIMSIPGIGTTTHVAELEAVDEVTCRLHRMVSLAPDESVMGMATPLAAIGNTHPPQQMVPHPDTYHQFEDIEAHPCEPAEFEALWAEAELIFPGFTH